MGRSLRPLILTCLVDLHAVLFGITLAFSGETMDSIVADVGACGGSGASDCAAASVLAAAPNLGALLGGLIPLRGHIKEDRFLKIMGSVAAEQPQINAFGGGGPQHAVDGLGRIDMELNARLNDDQFIRTHLFIGEMAQQPAIRCRRLGNALHNGCRRRAL